MPKVAVKSQTCQDPGPVRHGVPDLQGAMRIPIGTVAERLGLELQNGMIRCWRPENHQHGDRTPSVGIWHPRNKVKCFVCDALALSTVDLVMSVLGVDTYQALLWLDREFHLPQLPKGKHLVESSRWSSSIRIGTTGNRLEPLVLSGLFGKMRHSEIRLLIVLDNFADRQTDSCALSYMGLCRFSGVRKQTTIAKAIKGLEKMHAIAITRGRGGHGLNTCNRYTFTLDDSRFLALLRDCYNQTREEIEVQRKMREERRSRLYLGSFSSNEQHTEEERSAEVVITCIKLSAVEGSSS